VHVGDTLIIDTFAEAFRLRFARLVVTALDDHWLSAAIASVCGYGTSVIGCDAEVGVERLLAPGETPDGRPGAAVMLFAFSGESLATAVANRVAQCLLTCPTTAAFDGLAGAADRIPLGGHVRFFGDGHEKTKIVAGRRYWRVPVMDGEFLVEETAGLAKGVGGGNFIIQGRTLEATLAAARRAVAAVAVVPGTITPFPGGAVRAETGLHANATCCVEIVIDGSDESVVAAAMAVGIRAASDPDIPAISAGNYGGKLGKFHFRLRDVLTAD